MCQAWKLSPITIPTEKVLGTLEVNVDCATIVCRVWEGNGLCWHGYSWVVMIQGARERVRPDLEPEFLREVVEERENKLVVCSSLVLALSTRISCLLSWKQAAVMELKGITEENK
jgi:hypothetical protein